MGRWERVRGTQTSSGSCTSSGPFEEKGERWREGGRGGGEGNARESREEEEGEGEDGKAEKGERMQKEKERV